MTEGLGGGGADQNKSDRDRDESFFHSYTPKKIRFRSILSPDDRDLSDRIAFRLCGRS